MIDGMKRTQVVTAAAVAATSYRQILGATDRVWVGIVRTGNQGSQIWAEALAQSGVEPIAACDIYEPHLREALSASGAGARACPDIRKLLEHEPMDAGLIATPDHWHVVRTIRACVAGQYVCVKTPLSVAVHEGR